MWKSLVVTTLVQAGTDLPMNRKDCQLACLCWHSYKKKVGILLNILSGVFCFYCNIHFQVKILTSVHKGCAPKV